MTWPEARHLSLTTPDPAVGEWMDARMGECEATALWIKGLYKCLFTIYDGNNKPKKKKLENYKQNISREYEQQTQI